MAQEQQMTRYGTEERNLARLNPVLGLNRVPVDMTGWHRSLALDALGTITLSCDSGKNTVPHGIDSDVVFALTTAYEIKGRPSDRTVILSLGELCEYAGLSRGGSTYASIQQSIARLTSATYKANHCWVTPKKDSMIQTTTTFRILEGITEITEHTEPDSFNPSTHLYNSTTKLKIRLSYEIVASLNSNHSRIIDLDFYSKIKQPLGRMLYRVLEEQRTLSQSYQLQFNLVDWGAQLGMIESVNVKDHEDQFATRSLTPFQIRRALEPAHKNLIEENYISEVIYVGRGSNQTISYEIRRKDLANESETDPILVGILETRGVSLIRAQKLSNQYSKKEIEEAACKFDKRIAEGYKPRNRGALMCDLLSHPEKYDASRVIDAPLLLSSSQISESSEKFVEPAQPPRSKQQVEAVLSNVLEQTTADRELRKRLITQFVEGRHSIMDFITLARLSDTEARIKAAEMLSL